MITWFSCLMICLGVFAIAVETAGHAFKPELHFSWWTIAGWCFYILSILTWGLGRK